MQNGIDTFLNTECICNHALSVMKQTRKYGENMETIEKVITML